jgi:hypothetical protein
LQACSSEYYADCEALFGGVFAHDDSVNDRTPGSKLTTNWATTQVRGLPTAVPCACRCETRLQLSGPHTAVLRCPVLAGGSPDDRSSAITTCSDDTLAFKTKNQLDHAFEHPQELYYTKFGETLAGPGAMWRGPPPPAWAAGPAAEGVHESFSPDRLSSRCSLLQS